MPAALLCMAVVVLSFAAQAGGVAGTFLWDDVLLLQRTDLYTNPARWWESIQLPLGVETRYWRPLATTSFLPGAVLHGADPMWYRIEGAAIHAAAAAALFAVLLRISRSKGAAFLGAALWTCHPAHVETATWISARFDLLCGMFGALALLATGRSPARLVATGLAVLAAALCKEAAFVLVALVPLFAAAGELLGGATLRTAALRSITPAVAAASGIVVAMLLRLALVGDLPGPGSHEFDLLLVGRTAAVDAAVIAAPWTAAGPGHWSPRPVPDGDVVAWLGLVGLALAATGALVRFRRRPAAGCLAAAVLAALAPVIQFLPLDLGGGFHTADRFLYLPTMALAALGVVTLPRGRASAAVCLALCASYFVARIEALPRWNDPVKYWRWTVDRAPDSITARANLAQSYLDVGDARAAEIEARAVMNQDPRMLAGVFLAAGRVGDALESMRGATDLTPEGLLLRAELRIRMGQGKEALPDALAAVRGLREKSTFVPVLPTGVAILAHALAAAGETSEAHRAIREAELLSSPSDAGAWAAIARTRALLSEQPLTVAAADAAIAAGADPGEMHGIAGEALASLARHAEAAERFFAAARAAQTPWQLLDRAACELYDAGDVARAEQTLVSLLEQRPTDPWPRYHLAVLQQKAKRTKEARETATLALRSAEAAGLADLAQTVRALLDELR